jgi:hypothetical protein
MNEISADVLLEREYRNPLVRSTAAPVPISSSTINPEALKRLANRSNESVRYGNRRYPPCANSTAV